MELNEFVQITITNIVVGIRKSQEYLTENHLDGEICPIVASDWKESGYVFSKSGKPIYQVEFDVLVSISEKKDSKGKIGIVISSIGLGAERSKEKNTGQDSRIKFSIPITYPSMSTNLKK